MNYVNIKTYKMEFLGFYAEGVKNWGYFSVEISKIKWLAINGTYHLQKQKIK